MSRSIYKGPFLKVKLLNKRIGTKIMKKNLIILPEYVNCIVRVYNGQRFINLKIDSKMIGYNFGEFIYTRKRHIYKKKINYGSKNKTNKSSIK